MLPLLLTLIVGVPAIAASPHAARGVAATGQQASPSESPAAPNETPAAPNESARPSPSAEPSSNASPEPSGAACPTSTPAVPTPSIPIGIPQEVRLALFQAVWQAVDQNYVDTGHNGVDWAAARTTYLPEISVVDDAAQIYSLIGTMVS